VIELAIDSLRLPPSVKGGYTQSAIEDDFTNAGIINVFM
jgi:hypothetical protein